MKNNTTECSARRLWTATALAAVFSMQGAVAQTAERSGKAVVDVVCAKCHATGEKGAPKIGDKQAWRERAEQGLGGLTEHAVKGVRQMPAHGGSSNLTDLEIGRAITYMVNMSGGKWKEPASAKELAADRTGQQVVQAQCHKCHQDGLHGAPRIGDRDAWVPRLQNGLDFAVRSAIRGHGGMPPRGNKSDLTDFEIRNAIVYMYNPGPAVPKAGIPAPGAK
jgi:cytochrome c5